MFRNHKELVTFGKVWNLFEELNFLDNGVDCSLCKIANFHFNIKHSNLSTKLFWIDKTVADSSCRNLKNLYHSTFRKTTT